MPQEDEFRMSKKEADICKELEGGTGFARFLWYGAQNQYRVLVQQHLGPPLEDLLAYCSGRFSLKTVLLIAGQALARLEHMHNRGIVHRDIKPEHFLLGLHKQGSTLYLIDFGLASEGNVPVWTGRDEPPQRQCFMGTRDYASLNAHRGLGWSFHCNEKGHANGSTEQSRGDDLECLGYVMLRCLLGELP